MTKLHEDFHELECRIWLFVQLVQCRSTTVKVDYEISIKLKEK